jgi:branched-chain amino acid transport system permease protein
MGHGINFFSPKRIKSSFFMMIWFVIFTFPLAVMKISFIEKKTVFRWSNLIVIAIGSFVFSYLWHYFAERRGKGSVSTLKLSEKWIQVRQTLVERRSFRLGGIAVISVVILVYPYITSLYGTGIMTTALIYVLLGLGLNIIIGLGGLLNLGYAAFFAIGAYTYALLFKYFGMTFWPALPLGAIAAMIFGLLIGFPILRLRGDYLAIVTLAMGEIVRIVLNNMGEPTGGPDGVSQIPRPDFFGIKFGLSGAISFTYYIMVALVIFAIFVVRRLENSRQGRAWEAMREDEIAAQSMGINIAQSKLMIFVIGSAWAGFAGVVLAAKTTKVTPDSFSLMESVTVLCIAVLGGTGSIPGVILGAFVFKIVLEYFRAFALLRMAIFGAVLVIMMVFKPGGLIPKKRKAYTFDEEKTDRGKA